MAADPAAPKEAALSGIDAARWGVYLPLVRGSLAKGASISAAKATVAKSEEKKDELVEQLTVTTQDGKTAQVELSCNICYDDFAPSQLVEYSFDGEAWFLSSVCEACLGYYKEKKFGLWKEHILKPVCEASFKRLLKLGVISHMFDHLAFPSPDSERADYEVKDDNGKTVPVPRPVAGMRNWDAKDGKYKQISTLLKGAPKDKEESAKLWAGMLEEFKTKYGDVMIEEWLKA